MESQAIMLAARVYGAHDMRLESVARPVPQRGEALLRVASVGICGSDIHYYAEGRIGDHVVAEPTVLGHEFSAWVEETGSGVDGLKHGQLVAVEPGIACGDCESCQHGHPNLCWNIRFCGTPPVNGALSEYVLMPSRNCIPLPAGMNAVEGALLEPLGIAIHSVNLGKVSYGHDVAILGAGPIGLLIAAVCRAAGARAIFMTEPLAYRRKFALEYAADEALDPQEEDVSAAILRLTHGRGVDIAFEAAGASTTPQQAAEMARQGGKVIITGIPAEDGMWMRAHTARVKGLTIKLVRRMKHTYPRALHLAHSGKVSLLPLATHCMRLEEVVAAFSMVEGYQDGVIKAMIQVNQPPTKESI